MTRGELKVSAGWTIIISNAAVFFLEALCLACGWLDFSEFTTVFSITTPMFACYAFSVLGYFEKSKTHQSDEDKREARLSYVVVSFAIPVFFGFGIGAAILSQVSGSGVFQNFEEFKRGLMYVEVIFSGYAGYTIKKLFSPTISE